MNSIRVAYFIASRQLRRANRWSTALIVVIMLLTFLNLVVVGGILTGIPVGAQTIYRKQYAGDIIFRTRIDKTDIEHTEEIIGTLNSLREVRAISSRITTPGRIEYGYRTNVGPGQVYDSVSAPLVGVDLDKERIVTGFGDNLLAGRMPTGDASNEIVVGKNVLSKYTLSASMLSSFIIHDADIGDTLRVVFPDGTRDEFTIVGVIGSKIGDIASRIYFPKRTLENHLHRDSGNMNEIAVRLHSPQSTLSVLAALRNSGYTEYARIDDAHSAQGSYLDDIESTFNFLAIAIGAIGLVVAGITVFIVIFINAISRRKHIGIMKGIGVSASAVELAYILQAFVYAIIGSMLGVAIVYLLLVPYFVSHPIDFPFADGVLNVPIEKTLLQTFSLIAITLLAGYIPARMIVKQNTLDAILGR